MRAPRWLREWWAVRRETPVTTKRIYADQREWRERRRQEAYVRHLVDRELRQAAEREEEMQRRIDAGYERLWDALFGDDDDETWRSE